MTLYMGQNYLKADFIIYYIKIFVRQYQSAMEHNGKV